MYGLGDTGGPSILPRLASQFGVTYVNKAVSGHYSANTLDRMRGSSLAVRNRYTILWTGKNDATGTVAPSTTLANIAACVGLTTGPYLVLGHFVDQPNRQWQRDRVNAQNAALSYTYGRRYIDIRAYLASPQLWVDARTTPTAADTAAQSARILPPSVAYNYGHLNTTGQNAVAKHVARFIAAL